MYVFEMCCVLFNHVGFIKVQFFSFFSFLRLSLQANIQVICVTSFDGVFLFSLLQLHVLLLLSPF